MPKRKPAFDLILSYQTRLQGVANGLAQDLQNILAGADDATIQRLKKEWKVFSGENKDARVLLDRANKLIKAIEADRAEAFDSARRLTFETSAKVVSAAEYETSEEIQAAWKEAREKERDRRKIEIKSLSKKQVDAVLNYSPIEGETVAGWFHRWQTNDLERIAQAVRQGAVDSLSVYEIVKKIQGTRENNFQDGIVQTSRTSAQTVARTIINGVSNVARFETMRLNSDALDGVQFLATLDARTSFICASLDGKVWKGDDIKNAARPPLHPNCRSTLIPYIELVDKEGNVIDDDVTRAAANADFDKLARDAYNADAKQRGLSRRWDDLAPSTRKKYYYKAQRDWEAQNGRNAYRQVPSKTTFKEYFERQDDDFKRSWLGAGRYRLYKSGQATLDDLIKPAGTFRTNVDDIFAPSIPTREPAAIPQESTNQKSTKNQSTQQTTAGTQQNASTIANVATSAPLYDTPVESADTAVRRIDTARTQKVGLDRAKELAEEAEGFNLLHNSHQDTLAEYFQALKTEKKEKKRFEKGKITEKEYNEFVEDRKKKQHAAYNAQENHNAQVPNRESDRSRNNDVIDVLFPPTKDGKPFFEEDFIEKVRSYLESKEKGLGDIATEVFEMYNKIGLSVNSGKHNFTELKDVEVTKLDKDTHGNYSRKTVRLNKDYLSDHSQVRATLAHEIGHWIEDSVSRDRVLANSQLIFDETNTNGTPIPREGFQPDVIPGEHLFARVDGYSQKIYQDRQTEAISTAMEYLTRDADSFVRRNPKHFNLLLENLKEFAKK